MLKRSFPRFDDDLSVVERIYSHAVHGSPVICCVGWVQFVRRSRSRRLSCSGLEDFNSTFDGRAAIGVEYPLTFVDFDQRLKTQTGRGRASVPFPLTTGQNIIASSCRPIRVKMVA